MRNVSSAFWLRLQGDSVNLAEMIDLALPNGVTFHWTTCDGPLTFTLSGAPTVYVPFPGAAGGGIEEDINLGVSVIDFTIANSGNDIQGQLLSTDYALASLKIGRCFVDTPDLGRMDIYLGKLGDFGYDRHEIKGQARNIWKSLNVKWPYYTYQDRCVLRFGSPACGFNTASVTVNVTTINVGSSDTQHILLNTGSLNAYSPGRFNFGRATIMTGANSGIIRTIMSHTGDQLTLSHVLPQSNLAGMTLAIYPGCQKRGLEDCHSLYNNDKNFLGFPWIPIEEQAW